jgi:hypothetical protein
VLELGAALVREFGDDADPDTLSQWIAHDLAEKIEALKAARGTRRNELEVECRELILHIWKHRATFPLGHRPFESFDQIFRVLEKLDPSNERGRFFNFDFARRMARQFPASEAEKWLRRAIRLDRAARALITLCIANAAKVAAQDKDQWLAAAEALADDRELDLKIVIALARAGRLVDPSEVDLLAIEREMLKKFRGHLKLMRNAARALGKFLDDRIRNLD